MEQDIQYIKSWLIEARDGIGCSAERTIPGASDCIRFDLNRHLHFVVSRTLYLLFVTMRLGLLTAALTVGFFGFLRYILCCSICLNIGFIIVALAFADLVARRLIHLLPKKLVDPKDKAVLITGCDTGVGHQLAKRLDGLGFHVYACCLFPEQDGAKKLNELSSERLKIIPLDVRSDDQVKAAVQVVTASLNEKKLWAVVNNAGIGTYAEIEWTPLSVCKQVLDVNTVGVYRVTQAFLPLLRRAKGRVVIVASMAGRLSVTGLGTYSMSQYAAVALADTLRCELKKWGISVSSIEPMFYKTSIAAVEQNLRNTKKAWEGTPKDIQEDYGQYYFRTFMRSSAEKLVRCTKENVDEVVDVMIDAIYNEDPQIRYVPRFTSQFLDRVLTLVPTKIQDFVMDFVSNISSTPAALAKEHNS